MRNYFCLYVPLLVETQLFLAPATDVLYLPCCRWCKIFATFVEYFPSQQFFPPADILIRSQGIIIFWASKMLYCLSHKVLNLFYYNLLDSHRSWIEIFSCTWHSGANDYDSAKWDETLSHPAPALHSVCHSQVLVGQQHWRPCPVSSSKISKSLFWWYCL